ncbi:uncharacterized protein [Temnothorax nylanderi]|uniref:uncharacterized protein n=1 Tax=Temnothorax nylanderi TaxID=102681 RepID=UPI003A874312
MSVSRNSKSAIDYSKTSWIQTLTKPQLIETLEQLELAYKENFGIDELRKILRTHVSKVNKRQGQRQGEDKEPQGGKNENKKPRVTHTMAGESNSTKLEFQLGKDDWETYTERLELYFVANDVKAEKQAAVLLTKISSDTYKLVRDLCAPDKPNTKSLAELVKLVSDHLNPKPSETMERCKFYQAHQSATESVAEFAARLKSLSLNCNFGDAKVALRDQLVCGLKDHATKKALFREDKLTYDSAYKIAAAMEEAEKNASTTDKISTGTTSNAASVNVIQSNLRASEKKRQYHPSSEGRGAYRGVRGRGQRYNNRPPANNGSRAPHNNTQVQSARRSSCYCCGKANHWARNCYHRHSTCNSCKQKGHLATMCRSQRAAVQHLERESTSEEQRREEAVYDFLLVDDNIGESTSGTGKAESDNVKADPMYLNVTINGKKIDIEIDSGSYVAIISKSDKNKYFPENKITRKAPALNAYGKVPLESEGVLENLKVKLGNREATLKMRVMTSDGPILIGRQWLKVFGLWPLPLNLLSSANDCNKVDVNNATKQFPEKYPKLFGPGPGLYNRGKLKLVLKKDAQPIALKARHLPFALTSKVEEEINRLVKLGHLEKNRCERMGNANCAGNKIGWFR